MDKRYGECEVAADLDFAGTSLSAREIEDADAVLALWDGADRTYTVSHKGAVTAAATLVYGSEPFRVDPLSTETYRVTVRNDPWPTMKMAEIAAAFPPWEEAA